MTKKTRRLPYDPGGIGYTSSARAAATPLDLRALRESKGGRHLSYEEGVALVDRDRRTGGYDPARDADRIERPGPVDQVPLDEPSTFSDFTGSGMQTGLPFMDETASFLGAPFWAIKDWWRGDGFDISRSYHRSQALQEELQNRREARSPVASALGSIVGGAGLGAPAKGGSMLLNGARPSMHALAGQSMVAGGGAGTLYGAGEGNSLNERAENAATGGLVGAGLGVVAPYAAKAATAGASRLAEGVRASGALEKVREMFTRAGIALDANGTAGTTGGKAATPASTTLRHTLDGVGTGRFMQNGVDFELDPLTYQQRPFNTDYPKGADEDATGRLTVDVEGDPIIAKHVVGRVMVGGEDQPLGQAALEDFARSLSQVKHPRGYRLQRPGGKDLGENRVGVTILRDGIPHEIVLSKELSERDKRRVLAHETGHAFYDTARTGFRGYDIDATDIWTELEQNYHSNRTGHRWPADPAKRAASLIDPNSGEPALMSTPESDGYGEDQFLHELLAEAYRTAVLAPNTMKTLWPDTMSTLRAIAKSHPQLRQLIQFNGLVGGAMLGHEALNADGLGAASKRRERDTF